LWIFFHVILVNWAKGHRALLDVDAESLEKLLVDVEKQDRRYNQMRKRGMFWMCWARGAKKRGKEGGTTESGRGISSSVDEVMDDFELGALFEMEDFGDMTDNLNNEKLADS
jgi:hypothetical protein